MYISNPTIACLLYFLYCLSQWCQNAVFVTKQTCSSLVSGMFIQWFIIHIQVLNYILVSELIKIWYLKDAFLLGEKNIYVNIVFDLHTVAIRKGMWLDMQISQWQLACWCAGWCYPVRRVSGLLCKSQKYQTEGCESAAILNTLHPNHFSTAMLTVWATGLPQWISVILTFLTLTNIARPIFRAAASV